MAGLDLEMPTGKYFGDALEQAVQSGEVPMSVIDDKLVRRFRTMMDYGLFDNPPPRQAHSDERRWRRFPATSRRTAWCCSRMTATSCRSIRTTFISIAVIGPYAAKAMTGGGGSSHVLPLYTVTPMDGIRQRLGATNSAQDFGYGLNGYTWGQGGDGGPNAVIFADGKDISNAVALAKSADVAIVMVGDSETEGKDHKLTLSGNQDELVQAVAAANSNTVVVLKSGSAILMPWLDDVPALSGSMVSG